MLVEGRKTEVVKSKCFATPLLHADSWFDCQAELLPRGAIWASCGAYEQLSSCSKPLADRWKEWSFVPESIDPNVSARDKVAADVEMSFNKVAALS